MPTRSAEAAPEAVDSIDEWSDKQVLAKYVSSEYQRRRLSPEGRKFLAHVIRSSGGHIYIDKKPGGSSNEG